MVTDDKQTYHGDHFVTYINVKVLCYTPEANVILYVNCVSIQINQLIKITLAH